MTTLYRAAKDDYIDQGYSFAETRETACEYTKNPGFGGGRIYACEATGAAFDLRGMSMSEVAERFGRTDPGAIGVDEWIPRNPDVMDAAQEEGYSWIMVDESFPRGTTTWIWVGSSLDEPELTEV